MLKGGVEEYELVDITKISCTESIDAMEFIQKVYKNRLLRSTHKNDSSSRSHVIIDVNISILAP